ncbi:MAG: hypothetical protein BGO69_17175 [Bacteroidetes bacterium 46-16]|nr:MAG: hypothetical protein BGO69_17175 [Bacteroidetes bacterium 46-16]
MSSKKVLSEDWSDYDDKKKKKEDRLFFSCEEEWEVEYLVKKIKKHYPEISDAKIKEAIGLCCKTIHAPRPRKTFVECVMKRLGLEDNDDSSGGTPPPKPDPGPKNPPTPPGKRQVG